MGGQPFALALAQGAGEIDNGVARRPASPSVSQHLLRQRAGAGAELPDFGRARGLQRLRHLPRQRLAETRRQLGRGDEIAAAAVNARGHQAEFRESLA